MEWLKIRRDEGHQGNDNLMMVMMMIMMIRMTMTKTMMTEMTTKTMMKMSMIFPNSLS